MAFNKAKALQDAQKYVTQGKISQAIKQYQLIVEKDPSDLILLNTIGDLYIRDKNPSEGLKNFYKLADSYMKDGFLVKAIAIYKKISKLDQSSIEPVMKLGELYLTQGLNREAREQYGAAFEYYKRKGQLDKALEVIRKVTQLDPANPKARLQLAEFAERAGDKDAAAAAYLETATLGQRAGDTGAAESALKKASELDPNNPQVQLYLARQAYQKQRWADAEKIIASSSGLKNDPSARRLLLECLVASGKLDEAGKLLSEVFQANPSDFSPVANFAAQCIAQKDLDGAFNAVNAVAGELIQRKETEPLMQVLRKIWTEAPQHVATLELIYQVAEKTADELTIPEALEALGHAYVQAGQLEKAEAAYRKLVAREPENENYKGFLEQVLQKQGKEYVPASPSALSAQEMALEAPTEAAATSPEEAAMVKEAIDNSDLFVRYSLTDKAVVELEKTLAVYPNQVEIHKRILEACRKNLPARALQAAEQLERITLEKGDAAGAQHYREVIQQLCGTTGQAEPPPLAVPTIQAAPASAQPSAAPPSPPEIDLSQEFAFTAPEAPAAPLPQEIPLDLGPAPSKASPSLEQAETAAPPNPAFEEAPVSVPGFPSAMAPEAPPLNYQESEEEVRFYLGQGLVAEARKAVADLEAKSPGDPEVLKLRELVEKPVQAQAEATHHVAEAPPPAPHEKTEEGWELPTSFVEPAAAGGPQAGAEPAPAAAADMLGSLAGDLAASFDGLEAPAAPEASQPPQKVSAPESAGVSPAGGSVSQLSGLLDELGEAEPMHAAGDDPETHYNLGTAFREMGLLDEAIGEFQKVVKGAQKDHFPPNFLQACTLLAVSFMDKGMPAIAAKWYLRALEMPGLDDEANLSLLYDLGMAYEQAGDTKTALQKFSEVYSQNIDYRDVAEKIRLLQQKAS